ncbi:MAG: hypothetical protein G3M70_13050 [Candidatus Nitronauta litoralis]|uniref:N-acetylmuramoyl-L-alanine amidase n=1 Tax=Candidatus Nitronauta litoralis TaxID=2705533 RepID=A0A7T0BXN7_9BACT|nr:MAG: hypothetical protein G3M70_13050 [Candidatus Nitronauta litoralis]
MPVVSKITKSKGMGIFKSFFTGILIALVCFVSPEPGFAAKGKAASPDALYEKARNSYYQVLDSPTAKLDRQNWLKTIALFQAVVDQYPSSHQAYKATFTQGLLSLEMNKLSGSAEDENRAIEYFNRVVTRFAPGRLTDDALMHQATLFKNRGEMGASRARLQLLIDKFPKGDQISTARKELKILSKLASVKPSTTIADNPPTPSGRKKEASTETKVDSTHSHSTHSHGKEISGKKKSTVSKPSASKKTLAKNVRLFGLAYENGNQIARVMLNAEGPVKFTQQRLDNPDRVQVTFENGTWDPNMEKVVTLESGILTHVEPKKGDKKSSILMVEMTGAGPVSVTTRSVGNQFVLEFEAIQKAAELEQVIPRAPPIAAKPRKKNGKTLIVLDPGHGGKDEGAKGRTGILEKQVNLEISKRVRKILEKRYKYRVELTRTRDTFIELKDRGDLANKLNADLFVSIHANAAPRKSARGIETYYLGAGAGDRALETAARENGELVGSVEDDEVQQILASLISTTKINESARLAADVQKRLSGVMPRKFSKVLDLGVKEGPFYVLHRTNMPSILIEVGFLTNKFEERRLQNTSYQYWLAESIAQGIHRFIREKGPSI